jgi:hypothetical protein
LVLVIGCAVGKPNPYRGRATEPLPVDQPDGLISYDSRKSMIN